MVNFKRQSYSSAMVRPRTEVERVIGALLPLCLVWLFASCVSICAMHCADSDEQPSFATVSGAIALDKASDCDECPINAMPIVTAQDRTSRDIQFQTTEALVGLVLSPESLVQRTAIVTQSCYSLYADPSLKSLPGLHAFVSPPLRIPPLPLS